MSFDLEKALHNWKKSLFKSESMEDGYAEELESHLRDEIQRLQVAGMGDEAAFKQAARDLGPALEIGGEYEKARTRDIDGRFLSVSRRWIPGLIWSYGKLALRKLRRQKGYSLINIAGLAVGMACCILILTWVWDELSYDRFHKNLDRIFRIVTENHAGGKISVSAGSPAPLGRALVDQYPEVKETVLVQCGWSNYFLHYGDKIFLQEKLAAAGPSFFRIFRFPFLKGDPDTALQDPSSLVLTESLARKCFGDEDPMGKVLQMNDEDLMVTGVIYDIPRNSHLQFDYAFPAENMRRWRSSQLDSWMYMQFATYVQLAPRTEVEVANLRLMEMVQKNLPKINGKIYLQPLTDIHLHSKHLNSWMVVYPNPGNITYVYIFTLTAVCVLLLACINFMNLATARYGTRAKEVGIRKVLGARVWSIVILLSKDFTKWVLMANVIAWPLAFFAARKWLGSFAYRTRLGWELFALALFLTLGIAVLTVSYQAVRAAVANPVDSLRYE